MAALAGKRAWRVAVGGTRRAPSPPPGAKSLEEERQELERDILLLTQRFQVRERLEEERLRTIQRPLSALLARREQDECCQLGAVVTQRNGNNALLYMTRKDNCEVCDVPMLMIMGEAVLSCPQCGRSGLPRRHLRLDRLRRGGGVRASRTSAPTTSRSG